MRTLDSEPTLCRRRRHVVVTSAAAVEKSTPHAAVRRRRFLGGDRAPRTPEQMMQPMDRRSAYIHGCTQSSSCVAPLRRALGCVYRRPLSAARLERVVHNPPGGTSSGRTECNDDLNKPPKSDDNRTRRHGLHMQCV
jgi:hypothetical protein